MSELLTYLNGQLLSPAEARLPLYDAGFVFGATVTDLCRTFRHQLYRWPEHLARFRGSCVYAGIYPDISVDDLTRAAEHLVDHNARLLPPHQDLALVVFATPGPIGYYGGLEGGPGDGPATLGMHTFPLPFSRYRRLLTEGAHLVVPSTRHIPPVCIDPRVKQRSRLHWWLAEREAHRVDAGAIALLLSTEGQVTETAAANFLLVREGKVISPPRSTVLAGISLQVVEELCAELSIPFEERPLGLYDCLNAAEAMLTSTSYCLAGVSRINGVPLPWPGTLTARLLDAWSERVGLDIRAQILAEP
jgi:branched-subunit amino acid aminotransferase/4-amino-4-deoxychorismate lyase